MSTRNISNTLIPTVVNTLSQSWSKNLQASRNSINFQSLVQRPDAQPLPIERRMITASPSNSQFSSPFKPTRPLLFSMFPIPKVNPMKQIKEAHMERYPLVNKIRLFGKLEKKVKECMQQERREINPDLVACLEQLKIKSSLRATTTDELKENCGEYESIIISLARILNQVHYQEVRAMIGEGNFETVQKLDRARYSTAKNWEEQAVSEKNQFAQLKALYAGMLSHLEIIGNYDRGMSRAEIKKSLLLQKFSIFFKEYSCLADRAEELSEELAVRCIATESGRLNLLQLKIVIGDALPNNQIDRLLEDLNKKANQAKEELILMDLLHRKEPIWIASATVDYRRKVQYCSNLMQQMRVSIDKIDELLKDVPSQTRLSQDVADEIDKNMLVLKANNPQLSQMLSEMAPDYWKHKTEALLSAIGGLSKSPKLFEEVDEHTWKEKVAAAKAFCEEVNGAIKKNALTPEIIAKQHEFLPYILNTWNTVGETQHPIQSSGVLGWFKKLWPFHN